jgi:hypothetical protein
MRLQRNPLGKLVLTTADGQVHEHVVPVRAFPIQAPQGQVSLVGADGHEVAWIEHLDDLADDSRALVQEELALREFTPVIQRLREVSAFATPSTWTVDTDRGPTSFVLKGEEDIRRLGRDVLLVLDSHGVQFLIRQPQSLDRHSRKLLDRFL